MIGSDNNSSRIGGSVEALPKLLLGVATEELADRLLDEISSRCHARPATVVSTLSRLAQQSTTYPPDVIFFDTELLQGSSLLDSVNQLTKVAPVIVLANSDQREQIVRLVAEGTVEFVDRFGSYIQFAAALLERRLRWETLLKSFGSPWMKLPANLVSIFRHEINNPLTGILGNAELVLAHRADLAPADVHRLEIVIGLAVRLRETIRRLSNAFESATLPSGSS